MATVTIQYGRQIHFNRVYFAIEHGDPQFSFHQTFSYLTTNE